MSAPKPAWHHQTPSGWADDRLMKAYDLVHEVWAAHVMEDDRLPEVSKLLAEIECADNVLADIIKGRVA